MLTLVKPQGVPVTSFVYTPMACAERFAFQLVSKLDFVGHWQDPDAENEDGNSADADLGAAGPMIIPGTNVIAGGGKPGTIFTFDQTPSMLQTEQLAAKNLYCPPFTTSTLASPPPFVPGTPTSPGSAGCPTVLCDTTEGSSSTSAGPGIQCPKGEKLTYEEAQTWGPNIHVGLVGWQSTSGTFIYSMGT